MGEAGGTLTFQTGFNNTVAAVLDDGDHFIEAGEAWAVDGLDFPTDSLDQFFMVSTIPEQPDAITSFG